MEERAESSRWRSEVMVRAEGAELEGMLRGGSWHIGGRLMGSAGFDVGGSCSSGGLGRLLVGLDASVTLCNDYAMAMQWLCNGYASPPSRYDGSSPQSLVVKRHGDPFIDR